MGNIFKANKQNIEKFWGQRTLVTFHWIRLPNYVVVSIGSTCYSNRKSLFAIVDEKNYTTSLISPRMCFPCNWYLKIPILKFPIFWNRIGNRSVKWLAVSCVHTQKRMSECADGAWYSICWWTVSNRNCNTFLTNETFLQWNDKAWRGRSIVQWYHAWLVTLQPRFHFFSSSLPDWSYWNIVRVICGRQLEVEKSN